MHVSLLRLNIVITVRMSLEREKTVKEVSCDHNFIDYHSHKIHLMLYKVCVITISISHKNVWQYFAIN